MNTGITKFWLKLRKYRAGWAIPLALLSACGQQTFSVQQQQQATSAPGGTEIPAMVDILLAVDDSGSTIAIRPQLDAALKTFMSTLQGQKWDWRIAATSLTSTNPSLSQVMSVSNSTTWNYNILPQAGSTTGEEPGLRNIGTVLNSSSAQNQSVFLRPGAMLVVVVVSNGEDSSDCNASNNFCFINNTFQAGNIPISQSLITNIANVKNSMGGNSQQVKLFAAVNNTNLSSNNCLGGSSFPSKRYVSAASQLDGQSYNVCSGNFSGLFSTLSQFLQAQRLEYIADYVMIPQAPKFDNTLKVFKRYPNGQEVLIPESMSDGWEYVGYRTSQPTINFPFSMNPQTGYFFRLRGSAVLQGGETARVEYTPAGINPSN